MEKRRYPRLRGRGYLLYDQFENGLGVRCSTFDNWNSELGLDCGSYLLLKPPIRRNTKTAASAIEILQRICSSVIGWLMVTLAFAAAAAAACVSAARRAFSRASFRAASCASSACRRRSASARASCSAHCSYTVFWR